MMRRAALIMCVLMAGCATPTFKPILHYYLDPSVAAVNAAKVDKSLGIRMIEPARPYKQKIVYRDAGYVLGMYETNEWAEMPASVVTRVLTDALSSTQRFRDVGNAADLSLPDLVLTGQLRKFDEVHTTDPWTAECEVRLELRESEGTNVLWAAILSAKEPLESNATSALPSAMNRAVASIIQQAVSQIIAR